VLEDVLNDLAKGRVPNVAGEMGLRSELRYNRMGLARKAAFAGLCVAAYIAYSRGRRSRRQDLPALPAPQPYPPRRLPEQRYR